MCKKLFKFILRLAVIAGILLGALYASQTSVAHRDEAFVPDYSKVTLTEESDFETIFLQTGLGRAAAEKLLAEGNFQAILDAQELFFSPPKSNCLSMLGWFTREDRLTQSATPLVDLQPGDIVLTLSTHSCGWRHGHAGLVVKENTTLESIILGEPSCLQDTAPWNTYDTYAVLRLKDVTAQQQQAVADFALAHLLDVPYHLTAGFGKEKAPETNSEAFGVQCTYLVWYAWNHFGYDLDSDGGRLVSAYDLMHSDLVEVVQLYGFDPREFLP